MTKEDLADVKVGDILTNKIPINNPDHVIPQDGYDYIVTEINSKTITLQAISQDPSAYIYRMPLVDINKCNNLRKKQNYGY